MDRRSERATVGEYAATAFGRGAADRVARWLVLEMVLWPGALFVAATAFVAWQVRGQPLAFAILVVATLFSAAVGVRQWGVMLRAVFRAPSEGAPSHFKEASPRLTGRGTTER